MSLSNFSQDIFKASPIDDVYFTGGILLVS